MSSLILNNSEFSPVLTETSSNIQMTCPSHSVAFYLLTGKRLHGLNNIIVYCRGCSPSVPLRWPLWLWGSMCTHCGAKWLAGSWLCLPWYWSQDTSSTCSAPPRAALYRYKPPSRLAGLMSFPCSSRVKLLLCGTGWAIGCRMAGVVHINSGRNRIRVWGRRVCFESEHSLLHLIFCLCLWFLLTVRHHFKMSVSLICLVLNIDN